MLRPLAVLASFLTLSVPAIIAATPTAAKPAVFVASLTVTEFAEDGTRSDLSEPRIRYVAGSKCSMTLAAKGGRQFFISIKHGGNDNPDVHDVSVKVTDTDAAGKPQILAAPRIVVTTGQAGTIFVGREPGPAIEVSVIVEPVDEDR